MRLAPWQVSTSEASKAESFKCIHVVQIRTQLIITPGIKLAFREWEIRELEASQKVFFTLGWRHQRLKCMKLGLWCSPHDWWGARVHVASVLVQLSFLSPSPEPPVHSNHRWKISPSVLMWSYALILYCWVARYPKPSDWKHIYYFPQFCPSELRGGLTDRVWLVVSHVALKMLTGFTVIWTPTGAGLHTSRVEAGTGCWCEASVLSLGLLEYPRNTVAGFSQIMKSKRESNRQKPSFL